MSHDENLINRSKELLAVPSDTPFGEDINRKFKSCEDALNLCSGWLSDIGADITKLTFEGGHEKWPYPVPNIYAELNIGQVDDKSEYVVYMGHIDVVPSGDKNLWLSKDPFNPIEKDGFIYARGATDMKSNIVAFINAVEHEAKKDSLAGVKVGLVITGDEEWAAVNGSRKVLEWLQSQGKKPNKFIVGEPSSPDNFGTHIKVGRRGSLIGRIEIAGIQGHRAYKDLYKNPNKLFQFVNIALSSMRWNDGNDFMPSTDIEINGASYGNFAASAIVPDRVEAMYSIRYTSHQKKEDLFSQVKSMVEHLPAYLENHPDYKYYQENIGDIKITANLDTASIPYYSEPSTLALIAAESVKEVTGLKPIFDAAGGTTDGRFVHQYFPDAEIIELGLPEKGGIVDGKRTDDYGLIGGMHQYNERASIKDIYNLASAYGKVIDKLRNNNVRNNNRANFKPRF